MKYVELNFTEYSGFLFEVDSGQPVLSTIYIDPKKLSELANSGAPFLRVGEAIEKDRMLIWSKDSKRVQRIRNIWAIFRSGRKLRIEKSRDKRRRKSEEFIVKEFSNRSTEKHYRIELSVALKDPTIANDREKIKATLETVIAKYRKHVMRAERSMLGRKGKLLPGYPTYIWIKLFREDGPIRWLERGGWAAGNLIAHAEYVASSRLPSLLGVKPEEVWNGIAIRYTADQEAIDKALLDAQRVMLEILSKRKVDT